MKFRPVRGGLDTSMKEVREFLTSVEFESFILNEADRWVMLRPPKFEAKIEVKPYPSLEQCWDERIGWHTYIVTLNGHPMGFTDGPVPE